MSTPMSGINTFEKFCAYCNEILGDNWTPVANSPSGGFKEVWDWSVSNDTRKNNTWWWIFKSIESSHGYIHWVITAIICNGVPYIDNENYLMVSGGNGRFNRQWSMWAISTEGDRRYGPGGNSATLSLADNPETWTEIRTQIPTWARDSRPVDLFVKLTDIYDIKPTQRVLKVLHSQNLPLPADRDKNYMYFAYDKMKLYLYQSVYSDPFNIVETLPDKQDMVENMLYITLDGYMNTRIGNSLIDLGTVEKINNVIDPAQLALLRKVGTIYFMNAESRYLDTQTRMLQLPFQNGNYQLSLSLAKENLIDNDTTIKFNQETNQFEIMGNEFQPFKWLKDIYKYITVSTKSISTYIETGFNAIRSEINISDDPTNAIKVLSGGLYVDTSDFVADQRYQQLVEAFYEYKHIIDGYVQELKDAVLEVTSTVSPESIDEQINEAIENYQPEMLQMIADYDDFSNRIDALEQNVYTETDQKINQLRTDIISYIDDKVDNAWDTFPANLDSPYYQYNSY